MSFRVLKQIRSALSLLNPHEVRSSSERPLNIGLLASSSAGVTELESFLVPVEVSPERRMALRQMLHRTDGNGTKQHDLVLCEQGTACPDNAFTFYPQNPERTIEQILDARPELRLALARNFYPFRKPVVDRLVKAVSRENALFSLVTALPNVVPSFFELPWAVGEFASDTAFLTINQVRMAFQIAAASDKPIGYLEQKAEVASIMAGALGWRAIARELIGKIPMGGGLIPKAAVAYAGTYVVGLSLEKYHRVGYGLSRAERRAAYQPAFEQGKGVVDLLLSNLKKA